jgi:hypothetical protein
LKFLDISLQLDDPFIHQAYEHVIKRVVVVVDVEYCYECGDMSCGRGP